MTNYILPTNYNTDMKELNLSLADLESVKKSKRNEINNNTQRIANYLYDYLKDVIDDYNLEGLKDIPYSNCRDNYNEIHLFDKSFNVKPERVGNDIKFARVFLAIDSLTSFQIYMRYSYDLRANSKCKNMNYIPSEKRNEDDIVFFSENIYEFDFGFKCNWNNVEKDKDGKLVYDQESLNKRITLFSENIKSANEIFTTAIAEIIKLTKTDKIVKLYKKLYDEQYNNLYTKEITELNSISKNSEKIKDISKLILEDGLN